MQLCIFSSHFRRYRHYINEQNWRLKRTDIARCGDMHLKASYIIHQSCLNCVYYAEYWIKWKNCAECSLATWTCLKYAWWRPTYIHTREKSVNRSQMDIKPKTCDIRNWKKIYLFLDIYFTNTVTLVPSHYQCVRSPWHTSFLTVISATSASPFQPLHQRNVFHPVVNRFMRQTLPTVKRKCFFIYIFNIESFCPQKTIKRMLLFGSIILKHSYHFDY
jgi:hypothetical protein